MYGPSASDSRSVTHGVRADCDGCSRFQRSLDRASSRSALYDVADHSSAPTSQEAASSSRASTAARHAGPENRMVARFEGSPGAASKRYSPRSTSASTLFGMGGMA